MLHFSTRHVFSFSVFLLYKNGSWTCFTCHTPRGGLGISTATSSMKERGGLGVFGDVSRVVCAPQQSCYTARWVRWRMYVVTTEHIRRPRPLYAPLTMSHELLGEHRRSIPTEWTSQVPSGFENFGGTTSIRHVKESLYFSCLSSLAASKWRSRVCSANRWLFGRSDVIVIGTVH